MKTYNPVTSTLRHTVLVNHKYYLGYYGFWDRYLSKSVNETGGRNISGRITVRHRGSMTYRRSRKTDMNHMRGIVGEVKGIIYDSSRSGWLLLLRFLNGVWSYLLGYSGVRLGDQIMVWNGIPLFYKTGDRMLLGTMMPGTTVYNIEGKPGEGGKYIRSAGSSGLLLRKELDMVYVKLVSGKMVGLSQWCLGSIGITGNKHHRYEVLGKAGRSRWNGRRPHVRGVCMNPVDHPHGGGEGKKSKKPTPRTPWGKLSSGQKLKK
jgi:large subunit ribosomal protein L2